MRIELPTAWVVALNVAGWPVIHLSIAWAFTRLPARLFGSSRSFSEPGATEASLWEKWFRVRAWKHWLPDGAPWFRGFAKRRLLSADPLYLTQFIAETRRAEAAHWAMLLGGFVFLLWNPLWADVVMALYAIAANVPCIAVQRYNRFRLRVFLAHRDKQSCRRRRIGHPAGFCD